MNENESKVAKILMKVWAFSYLIILLGLRIALHINNQTSIQPLSVLWYLQLCIALLYLLPLILTVLHHAKKARMKTLRYIALIISIIHVFWLFAYVIITFFYLGNGMSR